LSPRAIFNVFAIIGATFGFFAAADGGGGTDTEADPADPDDPDWRTGLADAEDGPEYFLGWRKRFETLSVVNLWFCEKSYSVCAYQIF
jgi:hypothetical protein